MALVSVPWRGTGSGPDPDGLCYVPLCRGVERPAPLTSVGVQVVGRANVTPPDERARLRAEIDELKDALAQERARADRLATLDRLTEVVLAASDHRWLLRTAAHVLVPALADWCTVHYVPEQGEPPELTVAHGDAAMAPWVRNLSECLQLRPSGEPAASYVMRTGRTQLFESVDPQAMAEVLERWVIDLDGVLESLGHLGVVDVLSVPLVTRRGARGALWLLTSSPDRRFAPDDVAVAEAAAGRLSEGLDKVWSLQQHRHISATLQRALLPPRLPDIPGVEVAVRYWPAGSAVQAGGDFYDVFEGAPGSWSLLIGDVCGTGPDAAALTGIARHTVRAAARHGQDHEHVLQWVNDAMSRSNRDLFCTALYGTLDASETGWSLSTAAAGHPLPILARPGEGAAVLGRPGSLLGVFADVGFHVERVELLEGDLVVMYTDGITDLPPPAGRTSQEVAEMIGSLPTSLSAAEVADSIHRWVAARLPSNDRGDDVALLVVKIGPGLPS
jgi:serine phosphatase RsbU (regulator of sigma subunit)